MAASSAGRSSEALTFFRAALLAAEPLGDDDPRLAAAKSNLGLQRLLAGDLEGAEALLRDALAMRERLLGADHGRVAESLINLAAWHEANGDYEAAELAAGRALSIREALFGPSDVRSIEVLDRLTAMALRASRLGEAIRLARRAVAAGGEGASAADRDRRLLLGSLLMADGRPDEAEKVLRTTLELAADSRVRLALALALEALGRRGEAMGLLGETAPEKLLRLELQAYDDLDAALGGLEAFGAQIDQAQIQFTRAKILKIGGRLEEARKELTGLIDRLAGTKPSSAILADIFFLRASVYRAERAYEPAIEDLKTALRLERQIDQRQAFSLPVLTALAETQKAAGLGSDAQDTQDEIARYRR